MSKILQGGVLLAKGALVCVVQCRGAEQRFMLCVSGGYGSELQHVVQTCMHADVS